MKSRYIQKIKSEILNNDLIPKITISRIRQLYINEHLISFMDKIVLSADSVLQKEKLLLRFRILIMQIHRWPYENEYKGNEAEFNSFFKQIRKKQETQNPLKWIQAQLDLVNLTKSLTAKLEEKEWYHKTELLDLMDWSNSTYLRQISEGLPARKAKGGADVIIFRKELTEWLKTWQPAYHV